MGVRVAGVHGPPIPGQRQRLVLRHTIAPAITMGDLQAGSGVSPPPRQAPPAQRLAKVCPPAITTSSRVHLTQFICRVAAACLGSPPVPLDTGRAIDSDTPPNQLLLGPDAYDYVVAALKAQIDEIEAWRDLTNGTDAT